MKTSVLLIPGGHMECVKPNLSMSSCSDLRQQDEINVGDHLVCCKGKNSVPREFLKFSGVCHHKADQRIPKVTPCVG